MNINRISVSQGRANNSSGRVVITALTQPTLTVAVAGNTRVVSKGQNVTLTATVNQQARVDFYADGRKIANYMNRPTSSGVVTCAWRPATQRSVRLTAAIVINGSRYVTSPEITVAVTSRTGLRG